MNPAVLASLRSKGLVTASGQLTERAKRLADEQPAHAVVCEANTSTIAYQNDRAPGLPDGWLRAREAVLT